MWITLCKRLLQKLLCKLSGRAGNRWQIPKSKKARDVLTKKGRKILCIFSLTWLMGFVYRRKTAEYKMEEWRKTCNNTKRNMQATAAWTPRVLWKHRKIKISATTVTEIWSWWPDSNRRPTDYESVALPAELHQHMKFCCLDDGVDRLSYRLNNPPIDLKPGLKDWAGNMIAHFSFSVNMNSHGISFEEQVKYFWQHVVHTSELDLEQARAYEAIPGECRQWPA